MRSSVPVPGNPWPHDMLITVETDPHTLVDLLWVREAWNLRPVGNDLPPPLSDGLARAHARTESSDRVTTWRAAWPSMWAACVHHAGLLQDHSMFGRLRATADGSVERAELLESRMGPSWREEFGLGAFTDQYEEWNQARFSAQSARRAPAPDDSPERVSLASLIPAWRAGLTKIVAIPCHGSYTRVIGRHALLVTEETRDDPQRYGEALKQFHHPDPA